MFRCVDQAPLKKATGLSIEPSEPASKQCCCGGFRRFVNPDAHARLSLRRAIQPRPRISTHFPPSPSARLPCHEHARHPAVTTSTQWTAAPLPPCPPGRAGRVAVTAETREKTRLQAKHAGCCNAPSIFQVARIHFASIRHFVSATLLLASLFPPLLLLPILHLILILLVLPRAPVCPTKQPTKPSLPVSEPHWLRLFCTWQLAHLLGAAPSVSKGDLAEAAAAAADTFTLPRGSLPARTRRSLPHPPAAATASRNSNAQLGHRPSHPFPVDSTDQD